MKMGEQAGVCLEFLPPYSPNYNSIEEAFVELKAWIRKNYMLTEIYDSFNQFLDAGMQYMSHKPGNHFHSYHIDINT